MEMKFRTSESGMGRLVDRVEYVHYLLRCADEWESLPVYEANTRDTEGRRAAHLKQANRIRARASEIKAEGR
jgi:hypothetical protein